jgi:hypothetical protein
MRSLPPSLSRSSSLVALLILALPVVAHGLPKPIAKCRDQIAKSQVRYVDTLFKTAAACHAARSGGGISLSTDCNDAVDGDVDGFARPSVG